MFHPIRTEPFPGRCEDRDDTIHCLDLEISSPLMVSSFNRNVYTTWLPGAAGFNQRRLIARFRRTAEVCFDTLQTLICAETKKQEFQIPFIFSCRLEGQDTFLSLPTGVPFLYVPTLTLSNGFRKGFIRYHVKPQVLHGN